MASESGATSQRPQHTHHLAIAEVRVPPGFGALPGKPGRQVFLLNVRTILFYTLGVWLLQCLRQCCGEPRVRIGRPIGWSIDRPLGHPNDDQLSNVRLHMQQSLYHSIVFVYLYIRQE